MREKDSRNTFRAPITHNVTASRALSRGEKVPTGDGSAIDVEAHVDEKSNSYKRRNEAAQQKTTKRERLEEYKFFLHVHTPQFLC